MRVGQGYDAHRLVEGRRLILGGVEIPYHLGLLGHSDADVLCHAVGDALLGAIGAGDLGTHFPDTDQEYKNISSLVLLERIMELVEARGLHPVNVDATVVAQRPRLAPYIPRMAENLAAVLGLPQDAVNVKATTTEGMGFAGREEGIAAYAVVLLAPGPAEWEPEDTGF
ncbi:MAG: 2-C-methyl-D-erythritol 2,4-cyclodiphosphate synthase [Deltaproteobacteria bacterium]|nr:2-C-methyl-D-erythritol 2,4-cyclodiphosphate synthase [Deltaproteobacteria bacterium]